MLALRGLHGPPDARPPTLPTPPPRGAPAATVGSGSPTEGPAAQEGPAQAGGPSDRPSSGPKNSLLCLRDRHTLFSFLRAACSHHRPGRFKPHEKFQPRCHTPPSFTYTPALLRNPQPLALAPSFLPAPSCLPGIYNCDNEFVLPDPQAKSGTPKPCGRRPMAPAGWMPAGKAMGAGCAGLEAVRDKQTRRGLQRPFCGRLQPVYLDSDASDSKRSA